MSANKIMYQAVHYELVASALAVQTGKSINCTQHWLYDRHVSHLSSDARTQRYDDGHESNASSLLVY